MVEETVKVNRNQYVASRLVTEDQESYKPGDYITAVYDDEWWLGIIYVDGNDGDDQMSEGMFKVNFLHPAGSMRSTSFTYCTPPDKLQIHTSDILTKVHPMTPTGRNYYLSNSERIDACNKLLEIYSPQRKK